MHKENHLSQVGEPAVLDVEFGRVGVAGVGPRRVARRGERQVADAEQVVRAKHGQ